DARGLTPKAVEGLWERGSASGGETALAGVPVGLPALTRALKLQAKAGKVGFDWNDPLAVLAKIREEADEIEHELAAGDRAAAAAQLSCHGNALSPPRRRAGRGGVCPRRR